LGRGQREREREFMAAQAIQEFMNSEKAKKAPERAALKAQEAYRPRMDGPAELPYDDETMHDKWLMSRATSFWGIMHILVHSTCVRVHVTCLVNSH
jgi:hypothetical protein